MQALSITTVAKINSFFLFLRVAIIYLFPAIVRVTMHMSAQTPPRGYTYRSKQGLYTVCLDKDTKTTSCILISKQTCTP